jgi:tyrosyl-tRNA synthetase
MAVRSDLVHLLTERGYLHQCTDLDGFDAQARSGVVSAYCGFDCTADSLHVGNLLAIMMLRRLQQTGHRPIVLMGGGTTRIGDPSGKDASRALLTGETIRQNSLSIKRVFDRCVRFGDGPTDAVMVDNGDWLNTLNYIDFLRDFGGHFTINRMLTFDSVRLRLEREQALTFLEFNYMILQAYDFLELGRRYDCRLQFGGSDQWGNIVNGVELNRRIDAREVFGFTSPLLTTSSGAKMGKTAAGAVWLNEDRLATFDFWQYWRNTEDADVGRFLKLFTDLPLNEINRLESLQGAEINEAKIRLATEVTSLCRGKEAAEAAAAAALNVFSGSGSTEALPSTAIDRASFEAGTSIVELLVLAGLSASKSEARRLIRGGGARLNDAPVTDDTVQLRPEDLSQDGVARLSAGRKRHVLVRVAP